MTPEQIIQLRSQLISKGYDDEQATDMIAIIQNNIDAKGEVWDQVEKLGEDKDYCCFVIKKVRVERQL